MYRYTSTCASALALYVAMSTASTIKTACTLRIDQNLSWHRAVFLQQHDPCLYSFYIWSVSVTFTKWQTHVVVVECTGCTWGRLPQGWLL